MTYTDAEIGEFVARITQREWKLFNKNGTIEVFAGVLSGDHKDCIIHWSGFDSSNVPKKEKLANAEFIAAAPDIVRQLRAEVAALKADNERVCKELGDALARIGQEEYNPNYDADGGIDEW